MPRILLIDPDQDSVATLQDALAIAGYTNVAAVSSASFALTMQGRDRPDVIVCRASLADMDGDELCAIVRSDPALSGVRVVLLAERADDGSAAADDAGADRVLAGDVGAHTVVAEIASLLPAADDLAAAEPAIAHDLRGSLDVMDVADLAQAIGLGGKTGQLVLTLAGRQATIAFERGRVVHAEWEDRSGEGAFAAIVAEAQRPGDGSFCFVPLDRWADDLPRTMNRPVEQLLLSVAAEIDEGRAGQTTPAPVG
jgi:CheY-like chemotaxis protein